MKQLRALIIVMASLVAGREAGAVVPTPDSGSCTTGPGSCFKITNKNSTDPGFAAISAVASPSVGYGLYATAGSGTAVYGITGGSGNGVSGTSGTGNGVNASSYSGHGVHAVGHNSNGVYGETQSTTGAAGIYGTSTANGGIGIWGNNTLGGTGVYGTAYSNGAGGLGVYGASDGQGAGVYAYQTGGGNAVYAYQSGSGYALHAVQTGTGTAGYFEGSVTITGVPRANQSMFTLLSDARLKKNVKPLEGALGKLLQLRAVTYEWKDPAAHGDQTGTQRGFIAQEVEKVMPDWVSVDRDGLKSIGIPGRAMEAMLVESLRTLKTENDTLRAEMARLEGRVAALDGKGQRLSSSGLPAGLGTGAVLALLPVGLVVALRRRRAATADSARR